MSVRAWAFKNALSAGPTGGTNQMYYTQAPRHPRGAMGVAILTLWLGALSYSAAADESGDGANRGAPSGSVAGPQR
jgi:hypothetical protein